MRTFPITHYEAMKIGFMSKVMSEACSELKLDPANISFDQFSRRLEEMTFPGGNAISIINLLGRMTDMRSINLMARMIWHFWTMRRWERIYYVSKNLWTKLENTDSKIHSNFFKPPFPSFYVTLEDCNIRFKDMQDEENLSGFYLQSNAISDVIEVRILASCRPDRIQEHKDVNFFFTFQIKNGDNIEDSIDFNIQKLKKIADLHNPHDMNPVNINGMGRLFRIAINIVLYLTSRNPDIIQYIPDKIHFEEKKNPAKREKAERLASRSMQSPFTYVGSKVQKLVVPNSFIGKSWELQYQVPVSGHWRQQWMGSEKDGSKRQETIWIEPYIKGPDMAEAVNKTFIVKDPNESKI